jgi:hypothetical protein
MLSSSIVGSKRCSFSNRYTQWSSRRYGALINATAYLIERQPEGFKIEDLEMDEKTIAHFIYSRARSRSIYRCKPSAGARFGQRSLEYLTVALTKSWKWIPCSPMDGLKVVV